MKSKTKILTVASVLATALSSIQSADAHLEPTESSGKEKCYGVSKAGKNACTSKTNKHSCAGMAKTDYDPNEWVSLPKGECTKLPNSSLIPKDKI